MNLDEFKTALAKNADKGILFQFANGSQLAPHFHVTEVGKVSKDFVDCGGTRRTTETCVLQTLVANDFDHRLTCGKLAGVLGKADVLEFAESTPVEAETQTDTISLYAVAGVHEAEGKLVFSLASKNTACLAPDKCGLEESTPAVQSLPLANDQCCSTSGST